MEFFYAGASAVAIGTYNFVQPTAASDAVARLEKYFNDADLTLQEIIKKVNF